MHAIRGTQASAAAATLRVGVWPSKPFRAAMFSGRLALHSHFFESAASRRRLRHTSVELVTPRETDGDIRKALLPTSAGFLNNASRIRTVPSLPQLREEN
jgi:hypothetical protein